MVSARAGAQPMAHFSPISTINGIWANITSFFWPSRLFTPAGRVMLARRTQFCMACVPGKNEAPKYGEKIEINGRKLSQVQPREIRRSTHVCRFQSSLFCGECTPGRIVVVSCLSAARAFSSLSCHVCVAVSVLNDPSVRRMNSKNYVQIQLCWFVFDDHITTIHVTCADYIMRSAPSHCLFFQSTLYASFLLPASFCLCLA